MTATAAHLCAPERTQTTIGDSLAGREGSPAECGNATGPPSAGRSQIGLDSIGLEHEPRPYRFEVVPAAVVSAAPQRGGLTGSGALYEMGVRHDLRPSLRASARLGKDEDELVDVYSSGARACSRIHSSMAVRNSSHRMDRREVSPRLSERVSDLSVEALAHESNSINADATTMTDSWPRLKLSAAGLGTKCRPRPQA